VLSIGGVGGLAAKPLIRKPARRKPGLPFRARFGRIRAPARAPPGRGLPAGT